MTDDEKFDMWIAQAAQGYNEASHVPKEEMWTAIAAALPAVGGARPVARFAWRRSALYAIAATALLVVGIQIGARRGDQRAPEAAQDVSATPSSRMLDHATVEHFERAEALLTSFKAGASDTPDSTLSTWARDLLVDTRLMLDSPAARDPSKQMLLQQLELVLAQIVLINPQATNDERDNVLRSLERNQLMTKIRTAVPAGYSGT